MDRRGRPSDQLPFPPAGACSRPARRPSALAWTTPATTGSGTRFARVAVDLMMPAGVHDGPLTIVIDWEAGID